MAMARTATESKATPSRTIVGVHENYIHAHYLLYGLLYAKHESSNANEIDLVHCAAL